jgi:N-hydroxyarylamine O-acetyltransferase
MKRRTLSGASGLGCAQERCWEEGLYSSGMFDVDAYLTRIGLRGEPSVVEIHRAHAISIPFENLDSHRGMAVSLDEGDLQRKLVGERRGGYCFEQNLLLKAALEQLGAQVDLFLARMRYRANGAIRPRAHLVMRVREGKSIWHADVGFGLGKLLEPIPFGPGDEYEQAGWSFRIVQEGSELVLQTAEEGEWIDIYGFVPEPVPMIDIEASNWWTSTHPGSPFVTGLIVASLDDRGTRASLSDWGELSLIEHASDGRRTTPVAREDIPRLLADRFGLPGFALDADGRVVPAENS